MAYYRATLSGTARVYSAGGYYASVICNGVTFCYVPGALGDQSFYGTKDVSFDPRNYSVTTSGYDVSILDYTWSVTYYPTEYNVTCANDGHGTLTANKSKAAQGTTVTLTATPSSGYVFDHYSTTGGTISGNTLTMPAANVTVTAYFRQSTYAITCQNDGHGTLSASPNPAAPGAQVTLSPSPSSGYRFSYYTSSPSQSISNNKFTMPSQAVTVKAFFSLITYSVTCQNDGHGTLTASPTTAAPGTQISLTVTPASGYKFDKFTSSPSVTVSNNKFTMPSGNVTIKAWFKRDYNLVKKGDKIMATDRSQTGTTTNVGDAISDTHFSRGDKAEASTFNTKVLGG